MRIVYSILGLLAVAWLALYLSSYGVLVWSDTTWVRPHDWYSALANPNKVAGADEPDTPGPPNTLRCTYFVATGLYSRSYDLSSRRLCPRLWSFGQ